MGNRLYSRAHVLAAALELEETVIDWGLRDVAYFFPAITTPDMPVYSGTNEAPNAALERAGIWGRPKFVHAFRNIRPRKSGVIGPFWSQYWEPNGGNPEDYRLDSVAFGKFRAKHRTIFLNGFKLRCSEWVVKHADAIRAYFRPTDALCGKWQKFLSALRQNYDQIVGVHMRSTDFRYAQGGRYYVSPEEYATLIRERINLGNRKCFFLIFSDDSFRDNERFAELEQAFSDLPHLFYHGSEIDDLTGLMHCDRIICPASSTYSRWAAFAGKLPWAAVSRSTLEVKDTIDFNPFPHPWDY